ncbi:TonB-dependent receptor [Pseudoalteromonas sp. MMG005]|uniref:TonB-dependent receptor domain-containing protein n=1 Tax=Pseudoalteromonas sp. MMG005 TaxID=2822682 RepID=UPI001B3A47AA|nr:TonB-dependent receptor [Pseudoalteromonas sp. MMG005]MBQ4844698.1 TonB-dependent receptor [Pseudoalteromonas sp. MMG005]
MQFSRSPLYIAMAALSTAALVSTPVLADEQSDKMEIIEVHGKVSDADQIIGQAQMAQLQANDLGDIFRSQAEVSVGGSNPIAQKIYVRGLEDTMLNVSIDGALQAGYLFHHQGRLTIEPELLKQVDIVAGAGDATSGSGALGGAIRFLTKDASDLLSGDEQFGGNIKLGYYGNSEGFKASLTAYGHINDNWSGLVTVLKRDTKDMEDGKGNTIAYTASEQEVGFAKITGELSNTQTISASYDMRQDNGTRLLRAHWHPSRKNYALPQESERTTSTINYTYNPNDALINLHLNVFDTENFITHAHPLHKGVQNTYHAVYDSTGFDLRNTAQLSNTKIVAGVDYRSDEAKLQNIGTNAATEGLEKGKVFGLYVQNYIDITEQFQISTGVRYDNYELVDDNGVTMNSNGFSPNINMSYAITNAFSLNAGFAQALRGQKVKELFVLGYYDNDINLKEEQANNFEVGFKYLGDRLTVTGNVFDSTIKDAVSTVKNNDSIEHTLLTNVGDIENSGYNLQARYRFDDTSINVNYNHSKPKWENHVNPALSGTAISDQDWSIGTSSGNTLTAGINYTVSDDLEVSWNSRFVQRLTNSGVNVWSNQALPEKAGYAAHDLQATWYVMGSEELVVEAAVKNIFDKFYYDHATYAALGPVDSGLAEPGRDARLTLVWKF